MASASSHLLAGLFMLLGLHLTENGELCLFAVCVLHTVFKYLTGIPMMPVPVLVDHHSYYGW